MYHKLLSKFVANDYLPQVPRLSANDNDDEMKSGAVHRELLAFTLRLRKPRKTSARRQSDEGSASSHHLKWGPLPQNYLGRIPQYIRDGEGRKEENDGDGIIDIG